MSRYITKIRAESIAIETESGACCCCTKRTFNIIPYAAIQTVGVSGGAFFKCCCCVNQVTKASGLRFPHYTLLDGTKQMLDSLALTL